jgi:hypothetical protein
MVDTIVLFFDLMIQENGLQLLEFLFLFLIFNSDLIVG